MALAEAPATLVLLVAAPSVTETVEEVDQVALAARVVAAATDSALLEKAVVTRLVAVEEPMTLLEVLRAEAMRASRKATVEPGACCTLRIPYTSRNGIFSPTSSCE